MKISICIPIYNFDSRALVSDLNNEIKAAFLDAEIILIDDGSSVIYKKLNQSIEPEVTVFHCLDQNIGRSKIRNLFTQFSTGDYLLFLDCDGKIIDPHFLQKYLEFILKNPEVNVLYGGRVVEDKKPETSHILRWKFAKERENLSVLERKKNPYLSFQTNNFLIKKKVLENIKFDPEYKKYGYEDVLFSLNLKLKNIKITHLQNPVLNIDVESNLVYLTKVKDSIDNLYAMLISTHSNKLKDIKLVKAYKTLEKIRLSSIIVHLFNLIEKNIKQKLLYNNVSLLYLDFYKLGLLIRKFKEKN